MRVVVTGGAGYIGSTLVPMLLDGGHEVRVVDSFLYGEGWLDAVVGRTGFSLVRADIRDGTAVLRALEGMDAAVHLAAIVGDPACARWPQLAREVNLDASLGLAAAGRRVGVRRFIFASTCSNYGRMGDPLQYVTEEAPLKPLSLYAETKVRVEQTLLGGQGAPAETAVLRFATVFGVSPRMRFDLTVNEFTLELLTKRTLAVYGEQFWRPYIHVQDVARAVALVLEAPAAQVRAQVFNVGDTSQNYQKWQLVDLIRAALGDGVEVRYVHKAEDPRDYRVSFSKIHRTLGFAISRTVPDGIREVVKAIREGRIADWNNPFYRN